MEYVKQEIILLGMAASEEVSMLKQIEEAGRICYRSEGDITPTSYKVFLKKILTNAHMSVPEHSNICFAINQLVDELKRLFIYTLSDFNRGSFFKVHVYKNELMIAGNLRAWVEFFVRLIRENLYPEFEIFFNKFYSCYPRTSKILWGIFEQDLGFRDWFYSRVFYPNTQMSTSIRLVHENEQLNIFKETNGSISLPVFLCKCITDRGISHEAVRNRSCGFSQESTRYCNYEKRIGIRYTDVALEGPEGEEIQDLFAATEQLYNKLTQKRETGMLLRPEIARNILPHALITEMFISGRLDADDVVLGFDLSSSLAHFIRQRSSKGAHPYIRELAFSLRDQFRAKYNIVM